jgi:HK97 family phage major capsid protein
VKIKFVKNYLSFKADEIAEIGDEAADLIAKGVAVEVKEDAAAVAAEKFQAAVSETVESASDEIATKAFEKFTAKVKGAKKPSIYVGADRSLEDPQMGFKSFGDFAKAVQNNDLTRLKATGHSVGTDADGGYAVPQIWANEIFRDIQSGDDLLPRTRQFPMTVGDILNIPADNTNTIGGGMAAAWVSEGSTLTPVKGALRNITLQPYKLAVLTATTEELERDAQALSSYLTTSAAYALNYAINNAIVRGDGSSKPTGFVGHAATVTQTRTSAGQIGFADIAKMYSRFYGDKSKAVWLVNAETFPQLATMTSGNYNVFLANSSVAGAPIVSMFGIPVVVSEHMSTLGSEGDIALVDLSKYFTALKGGVESASSIHLYFNKAENAYRWTVRLDGKPSRASVITPASGQGTKTLSPFVVLDDATT